MPRVLALLLPALILAALPSCSRKEGAYEKWTRDSIAAFDRLSGILETVKDRESARAAVARLDEVTAELESLARTRRALKERESNTAVRLEDDLRRAGEDATLRLFESMMQIAHDPELAPILEDAFRKLAEGLKQA